jgi:hypothetical protein
MSGRFTRRVEDFACGHCHREIHGNGYTNHCPHCLWSRHVDVYPGDREETCQALMAPVAALTRGDAYVIAHRCTRCARIRHNKSAPADSRAALTCLLGLPVPDPTR